MTRPLPTLREFRKAYEETGYRPWVSDWWSCPLGTTIRVSSADDIADIASEAYRIYGFTPVMGFIDGYDGRPWWLLFAPQYWPHPFRYLAAFRYGRRVRRALIGGDK